MIDSNERTFIIGNDFLNIWNANIDYQNEKLLLQNEDIEIIIPISYKKENKVIFEIPNEESEEEDEYESEEEKKRIQ